MTAKRERLIELLRAAELRLVEYELGHSILLPRKKCICETCRAARPLLVDIRLAVEAKT